MIDKHTELTTQMLGSIQEDLHSLKGELVRHMEADEALTKAHIDHHNYIEVLIKKEEQRIAFRRAIIEKTLGALLWSAITGAGVLLLQVLKDHWR